MAQWGSPVDPAGANRTYLGKPEKGAGYRGLEIIAKLAAVRGRADGAAEGAAAVKDDTLATVNGSVRLGLVFRDRRNPGRGAGVSERAIPWGEGEIDRPIEPNDTR